MGTGAVNVWSDLGKPKGVSQTEENSQGLLLKEKKDHEVAEHVGILHNKKAQPHTVCISSLTDGN